jgi:hypothetical protein
MHPVFRSLLPLAMLATAGWAATPVPSATLTIVLDFEGPHTAGSVAKMKQEFEGIMKDSGLTFDWRSRDEAANGAFDNLVVVRFKGKCILEPVGYLYDERGPLAFTHTIDGDVLPFSEVACDKVTAAMRPAMFGGDYGRADMLLGRALARVMAHEMMHILNNSGTHGHDGVAKAALSGRQLITGSLPLHVEDLKHVPAEHRR